MFVKGITPCIQINFNFRDALGKNTIHCTFPILQYFSMCVALGMDKTWIGSTWVADLNKNSSYSTAIIIVLNCYSNQRSLLIQSNFNPCPTIFKLKKHLSSNSVQQKNHKKTVIILKCFQLQGFTIFSFGLIQLK